MYTCISKKKCKTKSRLIFQLSVLPVLIQTFSQLVGCCATVYNIEWKILDAFLGVGKLMTIEAPTSKR